MMRPFRQCRLWYRAYASAHPRKAKWLLWLGLPVGSVLGALLLFHLMILVGVFGRLPSKKDLRNLNQNLASEVWSADGVLLGKYFFENRLPADLKDVSPHIVNALVATEDARFFEHGGVDTRAMFRVLFRSILQGDESSGGGSTISQQLAKNLYPRKRFGPLTVPVAKVKEMFIAKRLESVYDKNGILALYLNTVPFSDNVFGIKVAAKRFFNTTPEAIKVEEAAVLIGMLKATTAYNPTRNPERAKERRNTVFGQMLKYKHLSQAEFDSLSQLPIVLNYATESHAEGVATYFREHLRLELEEELKKFSHPDGRPFNLYTDGLKIHTTLHSKMQQYAEETVAEHMKGLQKTFIDHFRGYKGAVSYGSEELLQQQKKASERYKRLAERGLSEARIDSIFQDSAEMVVFSWDSPTQEDTVRMTPLDSIKYYLSLLNCGLLAAEPQSGKILAWVGGINFKHFKYDHVKSLRQVGSTFKPVVYAKAIEMGVSPCEQFSNDFRSYPEYDNWAPRNADGRYGGTYSMMGGIRNSVNTTAVQAIMKTGIEPVRQLGKQLGISNEIPNEPGIALGSVDATLLEMVRLFACFDNEGRLPALHGVSRIELPNGELLAQYKEPDPKTFPQVLQKNTAGMMVRLLRSVMEGGTGGRMNWMYKFIWPAAGKTGTTDNNSDGWFIGFTPTIVAGGWTGASQPLVRWKSTRLGQGGVSALPLVGMFLTKVYNDPAFKPLQKLDFPKLPPEVDALFGCSERIIPDSLLYDSLTLDSLRRLQGSPADSLDAAEPIDDGSTLNERGGPFKRKIIPIDDGQEVSDRNNRRSEAAKEESERVQKKNEKLERKRERQKKRKDFVDGIFGKKD